MKIKSLKEIFNVCKVIVVVSPKGGVGKSMTAVNLAADLAADGLNVALVDCEEDGTTLDWLDERDDNNLTIIDGFNKSFPAMLQMYRNNFDVIVIDTAGVNTSVDTLANENLQGYINKKCLAQSDLIVVPLDPSPVDVRKSARFFASVEAFVDAAMGQRKAIMFLNKADPRELLTRDAIKELDGTFDFLPLAKTILKDYADFKKAEGAFKSVNEFAPKSLAAQSMRELQKEILTRLMEQ